MDWLAKEREEDKGVGEKKGAKVESQGYTLGHLEDGVPLLS